MLGFFFSMTMARERMIGKSFSATPRGRPMTKSSFARCDPYFLPLMRESCAALYWRSSSTSVLIGSFKDDPRAPMALLPAIDRDAPVCSATRE
jgi:hypothetical protein